MRIDYIVNQKAGCDYHRIVNPISYMPTGVDDTYRLLWMGVDEPKISCDILIYNKYIQTPVDILKQMQSNGLKIIVDIDDYWDLPIGHPNKQNWDNQETKELIEEHIKLADVVFCTSLELQKKVRNLNKNTVVIPNCFPFGADNYKPLPVPHEKITFMYMGGSTHLKDIKLLEGKFKRLGSDTWVRNNAEFILAGKDKTYQKKFLSNQDRDANNQNFIISPVINGEYEKMENIFANTKSYRTLPSTNLDEYINYYDQADVALIPLVENNWNSYKSTLKIVECSVKAIPAICSKVAPYWPELKDAPGILWVEKPDDWITHIKWSINNPVKVIDLGKTLMEYGKKHFELTEWNEIRFAVFTNLMNKKKVKEQTEKGELLK